jgi:hypothetical protein
MRRIFQVTGAMTCLLAAGWLAARPARACIPIPDASGVTDMESRRAVVWLRQTTFEMMFQNRYSGSAADFAWVIPLPGVPTKVDQPSDGFLEDLDRFTAPMIENQQCVVPCVKYPDAGALPGGTVPPPSITVWGSGVLGDLEYQVLSATSSQALITWLNTQGFQLPAALETLVNSYLSDGWVFFAAKIAAGASQPAAVPVVRFTFDRSTTPVVYPMRISAFNRTTPLDTLVWLISDEGTYLPDNYPVEKMTGSEHTHSSYATALDQAMAKNASTTFALQYAARGTDDYRREMIYYQYGSSSVTEMAELLDYSKQLHVVRLRARLNPNGMTQDLKLIKTAQPEQLSGWYKTPCPGGVVYEPCTDDPMVQADAYMPRTDDPMLQPDAGPGTPPAPQADGDGGGCQLGPSVPAVSWLLLLLLPALGLLRRRR